MMNYDETAKTAAYSSQLRQAGTAIGAQGNEVTAPSDLSPFTLAGMTFAETQEVCRRIGQLADRICGPVPTPVSGGKAGNDAPFVLPQLRQMAGETLDYVRSANEALSRIERSLP